MSCSTRWFAAALLAAPLASQTTSDVSWGLFPFLEGNWNNETNRIVSDALANGVDTLYVSVFRATDSQVGDLWITDRAGWNAAWGPVRPGGAGLDLVPLIAAAHQANLGVVAVLKCFDDTASPSDAAHRAYLLDVIDYLVHSYNPDGTPVYDIDGLALDYIRYISGTGHDSTVVTNFVGQIRQHVGMLSLHAYLLANRYSFDGPTYDNNFNSYSATMASLRSQFGQDWQALAQYLDVYMPMCYTADGSIYNAPGEHLAYVRQCASYANVAIQAGGFPSRRVIPVVKTYSDSGETTTPQTIDASIQGALQGGGDGYQSFRYGTIRNQPTWLAAFRAYAVAGANFPVARATAGVTGLSATVNTQTSTDLDQPAAVLEARFDWNDDAIPDTGWLPSGTGLGLLGSRAPQRVGIQVRDAQGHVATTTRRFSGNNSLAAGTPLYHASTGGNLPIILSAGPAAAGSMYLVLVSFSGSSPGFEFGGLNVPLNFDGLSAGMLQSVNSALLVNGLGLLDANGAATATFWMPPNILAPFVFQQMTWAAIGADPVTQAPRFVTNAGLCLIVP